MALHGNAGRGIGGIGVSGECPDLCATASIERVDLIAIGVDDAIGERKAAIDVASGLMAPALVAVSTDGIRLMIV